MTNYEKWKLHTSIRESPEIYLEMSWLFCVSTALQRRVWEGTYNVTMLFPNIYVFLIGPQALGKGQTIAAIDSLLEDQTFLPPGENPIKYQEKLGLSELPDLFCRGPSSTTFEKIAHALTSASNTRMFEFEYNGATEIGMQSCMYFCLEELNSLFKRRGKNSNESTIVDFLLQGFDCVKTYRHEIKTGQSSIVKNIWVNVLAGMTPDYLPELARLGLVNNGFMSRIIPVYAEKPRWSNFDLGDPTQEVLQATQDLRAWLAHLTTVAGEVTRTDEATAFMHDWYQNKHLPRQHTAKGNMAVYLGRKRVMVKKLAMCWHFTEKDNMVIELESYMKALDTLDRVEQNLGMFFGSVGSNTDLEIINFTKNLFENIKLGDQLSMASILKSTEHLATADVVCDRILPHLEKCSYIKRVGLSYIKL